MIYFPFFLLAIQVTLFLSIYVHTYIIFYLRYKEMKLFSFKFFNTR